MEKSGIFSLLNISDKESKVLLSYLRFTSKTPAYDFVNYLVGIEYLKFLDLLAGVTLKIPNRKSLYRDIEYVKIYNYVKERRFSVDSIRTSAKLYNKNMAFVKRALLKMSRYLNEPLPISLEELNTIKTFIDEGKTFTASDEDDIPTPTRNYYLSDELEEDTDDR